MLLSLLIAVPIPPQDEWQQLDQLNKVDRYSVDVFNAVFQILEGWSYGSHDRYRVNHKGGFTVIFGKVNLEGDVLDGESSFLMSDWGVTFFGNPISRGGYDTYISKYGDIAETMSRIISEFRTKIERPIHQSSSFPLTKGRTFKRFKSRDDLITIGRFNAACRFYGQTPCTHDDVYSITHKGGFDLVTGTRIKEHRTISVLFTKSHVPLDFDTRSASRLMTKVVAFRKDALALDKDLETFKKALLNPR